MFAPFSTFSKLSDPPLSPSPLFFSPRPSSSPQGPYTVFAPSDAAFEGALKARACPCHPMFRWSFWHCNPQYITGMVGVMHSVGC